MKFDQPTVSHRFEIKFDSVYLNLLHDSDDDCPLRRNLFSLKFTRSGFSMGADIITIIFRDDENGRVHEMLEYIRNRDPNVVGEEINLLTWAQDLDGTRRHCKRFENIILRDWECSGFDYGESIVVTHQVSFTYRKLIVTLEP